MKIRQSIYHIAIALGLCYSYLAGKTTERNMVFDCGGVLFHINKRISFQHLGMGNIAELAIRQRINPFYLDHYIKTKVFATLNTISQACNLDASKYHQTYDEKGNPLPLLMCAWLQGVMSCSEIRSLID